MTQPRSHHTLPNNRFAALAPTDLSEHERESLIALALRVLEPSRSYETFCDAESVQRYCRLRFAQESRELFACAFLDSRHRLLEIRIHADSLARLQGFLAGVEWLNDSAVTLLAIDAAACRALIEDRDGDTDGSAHLGPDGLTWVEPDASSLSPPCSAKLSTTGSGPIDRVQPH